VCGGLDGWDGGGLVWRGGGIVWDDSFGGEFGFRGNGRFGFSDGFGLGCDGGFGFDDGFGFCFCGWRFGLGWLGVQHAFEEAAYDGFAFGLAYFGSWGEDAQGWIDGDVFYSFGVGGFVAGAGAGWIFG